VNLILTKGDHAMNTSYGAIERQLQSKGITSPTIRDVSDAVIAIRRAKLPDPEELGNSGSFFKNPVLNESEFNSFSKSHPEAPYFKVGDGTVKIPAGWLIENTGYKGKSLGNAGVHKDQALVLVNLGGASGEEILKLARSIQKDVSQKYHIELVPEVNILG
ncbi:MAG: UDP-N-acetylmuramate dehydrogenase, partial [Flavobacteriaceae bacterium]